MRTRSGRWVFWALIWVHLRASQGAENRSKPGESQLDSNDNSDAKENRGLFSPRMDYEKWKPLGSGDPLKNDPTTVYVPPVLDRVHYWIDPALRTPDPPDHGHQKTEILLLGVSSKKPSTGTSSSLADSRKDNYDSFLKFVDGPKFNNHQRVSRPHFASSFFPQFYKTKPFSKGGEPQRVPYTMLMPPPMVTDLEPTKATPIQVLTSTVLTTPGTTTILPPPLVTKTTPISSSVTLQESNLIYHSSSLGGLNTEWGKGHRESTPTISLTPNPVSFTTRPHLNQPFPPEELVYQKHLQPPESYIQIQFAPALNLTNKQLSAANSDQVNFVTAPPLNSELELMHKGEVTDDNLDIANTYVKIGKTEAQMHSTAMDNIPELDAMLMRPSPMVFNHVQHPLMMTQTPMTMQTLQTMQTLIPPPMTTSPVYKKTAILEALEREKTTTPEIIITTTTLPPPPITESIPIETTTVTQAATTTPKMTTDPLFKHYKQPSEPLKGPLYLIIQGHSKVKTYGPSKQIHGIRVQETNEILDDSSRKNVKIKHLHNNGYLGGGEERGRDGRSRDLQTLKHVIQTRLGGIDLSQVRRRDDFKETELQFGYKVAEEGDDVTSERYRKGIVEEARKLEPEHSTSVL